MAKALATRLTPSLSLIRNSICNPLSFPTVIPPKFRLLSIRGLRLGGAELDKEEWEKRHWVEYALRKINGMGLTKARQIVNGLGVRNRRVTDLTAYEVVRLREEISKYLIDHELRRVKEHDITRLKEIQCYRGIRHDQGLPCRGQRTKTNSLTVKSIREKRHKHNEDKMMKQPKNTKAAR